jgi:hypothetical protein
MSEQVLFYVVGGALLLIVAGATIYLSSVQDKVTPKLMKLLSPFDVSFNTFKKSTFASGLIDGARGTINIIPDTGNRLLAKMRIRLDVEGLPLFSFSTKKTSVFLRKHASEHTEKWPKVGDHYFVHIDDPKLTSDLIVESFSEATKLQIEEFERKYEGVLIYTIDNTVFHKLDQDLLKALPELLNEHVLMTHFYLQPGSKDDAFREFVRDSVQLVKTLQEDLKKISTPAEPEAEVKRKLGFKP